MNTLESIKNINQFLSSIKNLNQESEILKRDTQSADSVVYTKNSNIEQKIKQDVGDSNGTSGWDIAKEFGTSMVPIRNLRREIWDGMCLVYLQMF